MPIVIEGNVNGKIENKEVTISGGVATTKLTLNGGVSSGVKSYTQLTDKPQINSVELLGNKTSEELKLQDKMHALTVQEIEKILYLD